MKKSAYDKTILALIDVAGITAVLGLFALFSLPFAFLYWIAWNGVIANAFPVPVVNFWQCWCATFLLTLFCRILRAEISDRRSK